MCFFGLFLSRIFAHNPALAATAALFVFSSAVVFVRAPMVELVDSNVPVVVLLGSFKSPCEICMFLVAVLSVAESTRA